MPKRGENIRKRKDGRWEGRYKSGINSCGKTVYSSVYGKTYHEVKEKLLTARQKCVAEDINEKKDLSFQEVLDQWRKSAKLNHKGATEAKYEYLIEKHILPELGHQKVSEITTQTLNAFAEKKLSSGKLNKSGGLSPAYVRSIMLIISSALKFAVNEQMCEALRTPVHKPSIDKRDLKILTVEEQLRLESYLTNETDETKLGILLSMYTGMRIGEICALTWTDIDLNEMVIHVRSTIVRIKNETPHAETATMLVVDKPKTRASLRDIPISSTLLPILKRLRDASSSKYVVSNSATFLSPRTYEYRYHKILKECKVAPINYHALRHTFATRCIEVGVDVKTLSEILGHADVSVTLNTYVHSSMELKRKQLEKLSSISA